MVHVGRHARRWGAYAAFGVAALVLVVLGWTLFPRYPDVPSRDGSHAPRHAYTAGGEACGPDRLRRISNNAKAARKRAACQNAEQEEQHNQEAASEVRYQSDIAKQALGVARYQGWVFWWQALAASAAFIAAGVAAWGAYRAFLAAEGNLTHAQSVSEAELRPYMFPAEVAWHHMNTPGNPDDIMNWRITVVWKNSGQTPARKVAIVSSHEVFDLTGFPDDFGFPDKGAHKFVGAVGPAQSIAHRKEIPLADFEVVYQKKEATILLDVG